MNLLDPIARRLVGRSRPPADRTENQGARFLPILARLWGRSRRSRAGRGGTGGAGESHGTGDPAGRVRNPERQVAIRRASYLVLTLVAIAFSIRAVIGERGILETHRSRRELARLESEVDRWERRNAFLQARVKALREDPATIEVIARERLDWVKPGEITFLFPFDASSPEPGDPGPVAPGEFSVARPEDSRP